MTPFGIRTHDELNREHERMQNEWFFKWHFIGSDGPVSIDSFDGRSINYGGIKYSGSAREVYWQTLNRYLGMKASEYFDRAEEEVRKYSYSMATKAVAEYEAELKSFASRIAEIATEKDKVLRGNGFEFPAQDSGRRSELIGRFNILPKVNALKELIEDIHASTVSKAADDDEVWIFGDNVEKIQHLVLKIDELIKLAAANNMLRTIDENQTLQHIAELKAAKELLTAPQTRKSLFSRLVFPSAKWIAEKAGSVAITEIVKNVIMPLIKSLF